MNLNVANCPRCGRVFSKGLNNVCPACVKDIEMEYGRCAEYLRENRGATIQELSDATDVSIRQITKFIREGRISVANSPNMSYPCESCGIMIREGHLCDSCRQRLMNDVKGIAKENKSIKQNSEHGAGYQIRNRFSDDR